MKSILTALAAGLLSCVCLGFAGCVASATGSAPAPHKRPLTLQENSSVRDDQVREDPAAFAIGASRHQVIATMGEPNRSNFGEGEDDEVYAFHSDGSKLVNSRAGHRAIAPLAINPHFGMVSDPVTATKMTVYHVYYSSDGTVEAVRKVSVDDPTAVRDYPELDSRMTE
jgi:hypothetical protein